MSLQRPAMVIGVAVLWLVASFGCAPRAMRGGEGTQNPELDAPALSVTLDREDINYLVADYLERLEASGFWRRHGSKRWYPRTLQRGRYELFAIDSYLYRLPHPFVVERCSIWRQVSGSHPRSVSRISRKRSIDEESLTNVATESTIICCSLLRSKFMWVNFQEAAECAWR